MATLAELEREVQRRGIGVDASSINLQSLEAEAAKRGLAAPAQELPQETGLRDAAILEPVAAIGSAIGTTIVGGLAGLAGGVATAVTEGPAAGAARADEILKDIQSTAFQPQTEGGKAALKSIGEFAKKGLDVANASIGQLVSLAGLLTGKSDEEQFQAFKEVKERGIGKFLGDATLEATGSPLAATVAATLPTAIAEVAGAKGSFTAARAIPDVAEAATGVAAKTLDVTGTALAPVAEAGKQIVEGVSGLQRQATRDRAVLIEEGSNFSDLAKFELADPSAAPTTGIEKFFDQPGPNVKIDKEASEALRQGFKGGVIQPLKNASKPDKGRMLAMTNIAERAKRDELFGLSNRGSDVAGDVLMSKLNVIRVANKRAGKEIGKFTKTLAGKQVNSLPIGNRFVASLDDMGIKVTDDLKLNFEGSVIEGLAGPERVMTDVFNRMTKGGVPDAKQLHDLKLFIDEHITFGKNAEGLAGKAERALRTLRADVNATLGDKIPKYKEVNTTYSETIKALDNFQTVAGQKMNLLGPNADKATGTLMRRLMGNATSRINLLDALDNIESVIKKHGGTPGQKRIEGAAGVKDDLKMLVLYADELDRVFGAAPRTSLQGQFDQALGTAARAVTSKSGLFEAGIDVLGKGVEKARGINEAAAFKSAKELLKKGRK